MKLVIDRKRWLRGDIQSYLYRPKDKKMCCLGFLGKACGVKVKDMKGITILGGLNDENRNKYPSGVDYRDYSRLMKVNDDPLMSDDEREQTIASYMKDLGVKVTFK